MSAWTPTFTGVPQQQVGQTFDVALGYFDPTTQVVQMVGYTVSPSGNEVEATDVTDDQHLVQISSPNSTDRFARFPQASQGDWSKGERQRVYIDPSSYYLSDGMVDVSTPGSLRLLPSARVDTFTLNGTYNTVPLATDGGAWYAGISTGGTNFAEGLGGAPVLNSVANGHEIFDLLYTPFALVGLTDEGLWTIVPPAASAVLAADVQTMAWLPGRCMAYLNDVIYFINNSNGSSYIKTYTRSTDATATFLTSNASERFYQCVASTTSGIFFATTSKLPFQNFWYVCDGVDPTSVTRIKEVQGRVEYALEVLGTLYVLVREFQTSYLTNPAWTLYGVVGNQVTLVDDARSITDPNFAPTCSSVATYDANSAGTMDFKPMLTDDGRFLYVAWPGLATKRIDLVNAGISQIGDNATDGQASVSARRFVTADVSKFVDISAYGTTCKVKQYDQAATSGSVTDSFYDFGSPGNGKIFRSVEFQSSAALVGTQAIAMSYRLDQTSGFTSMTTRQVGTRNFSAPFPGGGVKGTEIQVKVTLTADAGAGTPTLTSMSVVADQGRVINITVACRRDQQARGGVDNGPLTAQALQANVMNIRNLGGGRGYAYIADPTAAGGVSLIQVRLNDVKRVTPNGARTGLATVDGEPDMEADLEISLIEDLDP